MVSQNLVHRAKSITAILLFVAILATPTQATTTRPPLGLQLYCLKNVALCRASGPATISADDEVYKELQRVNARVNASITPVFEGASDQWSASTRSGDCEDYVLAKRAALMRMGFPGAAMSIGYTRIKSGAGHAVLLVRTDRGEYVLDNLNVRVELLNTHYRIEKSSTFGLLDWKAYP